MNKQIKLLILTAILLLAAPYQAWAYKVVIDAGHGGRDPGAIGVNGLQEKVVNLDIALKVRDILRNQGYEVFMTREDDSFLTLADRVEFTDRQLADLFVSIHANSYGNQSARGSMVLYYDQLYPQKGYPASEAMQRLSPYSKQLAEQVLDSLVDAAGTVDKGLLPSAVFVARMGSIPSVLVETGFLSNSSDAAMLADDAVRSRMAEGIAKGIANYEPPLFLDTIGHWGREAILRMKGEGLIEGIHNRYQPDRALTRAEFVTIMDRMFQFDRLMDKCKASVTSAVYGCKETVNQNSKQLPKDMTKQHWAYDTINKAVKLNLLQGYSDGTLRPDRPVTRGEVAVLFRRLILATGTPAVKPSDMRKSTFIDVPGTLWSADAINALQASGIIQGITETQFMPERTMSRAEMAAMMDRYTK